jgi:hypothetical protein
MATIGLPIHVAAARRFLANSLFITPLPRYVCPRVLRWTAKNRQLIDRAKPAITDRRPRPVEFYFVASSVRKSVWTLVRPLRGPHLSTWA